MREIKSSRHSRHLLLYHMVWIPKYRRRILVGHVAERLKEVIRQTASKRDWDVAALEVMPDHVHLFISPPPTTSPADVVKVCKGVSARLLLKEFPDLARKTGRGTLWAPSYFVGSAGNVSAETIQRYIEEQQTRG
jgi:putative transposase